MKINEGVALLGLPQKTPKFTREQENVPQHQVARLGGNQLRQPGSRCQVRSQWLLNQDTGTSSQYLLCEGNVRCSLRCHHPCCGPGFAQRCPNICVALHARQLFRQLRQPLSPPVHKRHQVCFCQPRQCPGVQPPKVPHSHNSNPH